MGGEKRKIELTVAKSELKEFLANLGQGLEDGELTLGATQLNLEDLAEFKLEFKALGDSYLAKIKAKQATPAYMPGEHGAEATVGGAAMGGKPKYKSLKKRMKKPWKMIRETLALGNLPDRALVEAFVKDSELMVTYPGKGDEFYGAYTVGLERFAAAYEAGDVQAAADAAQALERMKKACHDRYD